MAFDIERVERLPQTIGYIDIRELVELSLSAPAMNAAMTLVASADALIIDLHQCVGGDPASVAWLASCLFDLRSQLSMFYSATEQRANSSGTSERISGQRSGSEKPVYSR